MNRLLTFLLGLSISLIGFTLLMLALAFNLNGYGLWETRGLLIGSLEGILIAIGIIIGGIVNIIGILISYSSFTGLATGGKE